MRIVKEMNPEEFWRSLKRKGIALSGHALDRLADAQRDIYEEEILSRTSLKKPSFVGLQDNGRFAAFYRRKRDYLKLIIVEKPSGFEVITFINVHSVPEVVR